MRRPSHRWFRARGTLLLSSTDRWKGTGHNGFLRTGTGAKSKDWLVLASYDTLNLGNKRMTQIRPLTWDKSGWPVVGEILERAAAEVKQ